MNISKVVVRLVGAGVLVGALGVWMPSTGQQAGAPQAGAGHAGHAVHENHAGHEGHMGMGHGSHSGDLAPITGGTETSRTGNKLELVDPSKSKYRPNVLRASSGHRTKARRLLRGVNRFCQTTTLAELKESWRPGVIHQNQPTHYFNPNRGASGIDPTNPRAALVYDGKVGGVMFTGQPLPKLGAIPRAHRHPHGSMGTHQDIEMVHVYCTDDLRVKSMREAYTPNRQLGVLADTKRLRNVIRPAVMDLRPRQLREVRNKVRGYVGKPSYAPSARRAGGPDPRLRAMRVEIRRGLMHMNEAQLRSVWRLMKSY